VDIWQEVGGSITVELQIPGAPAELLSAQDAMALAELLERAAIVPGPGQDEPMPSVFDVLDDHASKQS
jgi:hypothetical protein